MGDVVPTDDIRVHARLDCDLELTFKNCFCSAIAAIEGVGQP
jgi:hypothetical protein